MVQITCSDSSVSEAELVVKVYNQYHLNTSSEPLFISLPPKNETVFNELETTTIKNNSFWGSSDDVIYYIALVIFSFFLIFLIFLKKKLKNKWK